MRVGGTRLKLNNNNEKAKHKQNEYNNNKWSNTFSQYLFLNIKNAEKILGFPLDLNPGSRITSVKYTPSI